MKPAFILTGFVLILLLDTRISVAQTTMVADNTYGFGGHKNTTTENNVNGVIITEEIYDGSFPAKLRRKKIEYKGNDKSSITILTEYTEKQKKETERTWELDVMGDLVATGKREFDENENLIGGYSKIRSDNKWIREKYDPQTGKYVPDGEEIIEQYGNTLKSGDLTGVWEATGYNCNVSAPSQLIKIEVRGGQLVATKITGDNCVPAGSITWEGTFNGNAITGRGQVSSGPNTALYWISTSLNVTDKNTLNGFFGVTYKRKISKDNVDISTTNSTKDQFLGEWEWKGSRVRDIATFKPNGEYDIHDNVNSTPKPYGTWSSVGDSILFKNKFGAIFRGKIINGSTIEGTSEIPRVHTGNFTLTKVK